MRPHLDALTPREREVLGLIRRGLTNEEIAQRLGITLDGAKYHVSQILSKLGVSTREEAAAVALERRRWWAQWPLWGKTAGAATVAATIAALVLMAWGVARTEGPSVGTSEHNQVPMRQSFRASASTQVLRPMSNGSSIGTPHPNRDSAALSVRPCRAEDMRAALINGNGAGGWIIWSFAFANTSATECRLQGVPIVQLRGSEGQVFSEGTPSDTCIHYCPWRALLPPNQSPAFRPGVAQELQPGQASLTMTFWGRRDDADCTPPATSLLVGLPEDGGDISIPVNNVDSCIRLSVGRFLGGRNPSSTP